MIYAIFALVTLLVLMAGAALGLLIMIYKPLRVFLTWNTRYAAQDYETAVTSVKNNRPARRAVKTENRGRQVKQTDELVAFEDLPFEEGYKALEEVASGR